MSHHSDENALTASSESFWEPGNYKKTTKRIDDGHKLCNDLIQLVTERAEIEKTYAKSLKAWSKNWNNLIEKGTKTFSFLLITIKTFTSTFGGDRTGIRNDGSSMERNPSRSRPSVRPAYKNPRSSLRGRAHSDQTMAERHLP